MAAPSIIDARRHQMFPTLAPADIARLRRFGQVRTFAKGDVLGRVGEVGPGLSIILSGSVEISQRHQSSPSTPIVTHGPGALMGELAQLADRPALVDALAQDAVEALIILSRHRRRIFP